jgi:hypothetical protein
VLGRVDRTGQVKQSVAFRAQLSGLLERPHVQQDIVRPLYLFYTVLTSLLLYSPHFLALQFGSFHV